jgi:hypothetical protein
MAVMVTYLVLMIQFNAAGRLGLSEDSPEGGNSAELT